VEKLSTGIYIDEYSNDIVGFGVRLVIKDCDLDDFVSQTESMLRDIKERMEEILKALKKYKAITLKND